MTEVKHSHVQTLYNEEAEDSTDFSEDEYLDDINAYFAG